MNKENLLKLAAYLDTLPLDYEHFEMSDFMQDGDAQEAFQGRCCQVRQDV